MTICAWLGVTVRPVIATLSPISHVTGTLLLFTPHEASHRPRTRLQSDNPLPRPSFLKASGSKRCKGRRRPVHSSSRYSSQRRSPCRGQARRASGSTNPPRLLLRSPTPPALATPMARSIFRASSVPPSQLVISAAIQTSCTASQQVLRISIRKTSSMPNAYASCTPMLQPQSKRAALASIRTTMFGPA